MLTGPDIAGFEGLRVGGFAGMVGVSAVGVRVVEIGVGEESLTGVM